MTQYHLIKRGLYYRPEAAGYTTNVADAGVFSQEYATEEVQDTGGDVRMVPVDFGSGSIDPVKFETYLLAKQTVSKLCQKDKDVVLTREEVEALFDTVPGLLDFARIVMS